jgi:hypothetical protein
MELLDIEREEQSARLTGRIIGNGVIFLDPCLEKKWSYCIMEFTHMTVIVASTNVKIMPIRSQLLRRLRTG